MGKKKSTYDFSGWATRNNLRCSDGRVINKDAFINNDGKTVPLVWDHQHTDPLHVLGHALLENRDDGVYTYGSFNDTPAGLNAKKLVEHGDVSALSIYANCLKQNGPNVVHGAIRELSLVLAGANPGAFIDSVIKHGENIEDEAVIYTGEPLVIKNTEGEIKMGSLSHEEDNSGASNTETVEDVFNTLSEKQKTLLYALVGQAIEEAKGEKEDEEDEGEENMKHNVFDGDDLDNGEVLSHSEMVAVFSDAKRYGSLKDSVLAHGITDIDFLFPDAKSVDGNIPSFITRNMDWVTKVMGATKHSPFSRIKSVFANLTESDARAKGYITGNLKAEEVFSLLKRTTTSTTIYKKQKLDRDDVVDITDFDVVSWLKSEMRLMLDEEIARAVLVGDGRLASSDDKINESNIRPICSDADLYTIKTAIAYEDASTDDDLAKMFISSSIKSRKQYKGSGNPVMFCTEDVLTDCLLLKDTTGRVIYESVDKLATALRVSDIVTVPVMENVTRVDSDSKTRTLLGCIVNLTDYNLGADKGGAINMFDDFDIDYNQQKYLIETRCSGALVRPYSAIAIELLPAIA